MAILEQVRCVLDARTAPQTQLPLDGGGFFFRAPLPLGLAGNAKCGTRPLAPTLGCTRMRWHVDPGLASNTRSMPRRVITDKRRWPASLIPDSVLRLVAWMPHRLQRYVSTSTRLSMFLLRGLSRRSSWRGEGQGGEIEIAMEWYSGGTNKGARSRTKRPGGERPKGLARPREKPPPPVQEQGGSGPLKCDAGIQRG